MEGARGRHWVARSRTKKRHEAIQWRRAKRSIFPNAGIIPIRFDGRRRPLATLSAQLPELP